jgi:hypothetical protein
MSCVALGFENIFQEVGVTRVLLIRSALRNSTVEIRQGRQPQGLRQNRNAFVLEIVHVAPPGIRSS